MSNRFDGPTRCAVLLYTLGLENATSLLSELPPDQVKRIAKAAQRLQGVDQSSMEQILQDFTEAMGGRKLLPGESASFMQTALEVSGIDTEQLEQEPDVGLVPEADSESLGLLLRQEHPQTAALVLANIDPARAAKALQYFEPENKVEVIRRMAGISKVSQNVLDRIERTLSEEFAKRTSGSAIKVNGIELAAGVLKRLKKDDSGQILDELMKESSTVGEAVKQRMFTFEELGNMDDRGIRNLLKEVDSQLLAKALKAADDHVRNKIYHNMSERAATMLAEDVETLPPMRLSEVEEAQGEIVNIAIGLIQDGKAVVMGAGGDDEIV